MLCYWFHQLSFNFYEVLAKYTQCYCGEIRRMFQFIIDIYCLKADHRPDKSINVVE